MLKFIFWFVSIELASGCAIDPALYIRLFEKNMPMFKEMTRLIEESDAKKVLDIGTGPGEPALLIARTIPDVEVTGVDVQPDMIEKAKARKPQSLANIGFSVASAEDLSAFPDSSFDAVTMSFVLMFVENKRKSIEEILRVLKPGGKAYISVWKHLVFFEWGEQCLTHAAAAVSKTFSWVNDTDLTPTINPHSMKGLTAVEDVIATVTQSNIISDSYRLEYDYEMGNATETCDLSMISVGTRIQQLVEKGWKTAKRDFCQIFMKMFELKEWELVMI